MDEALLTLEALARARARRAVRRVLAEHRWRLTVAVVDAAEALVDAAGRDAVTAAYERLAAAVAALHHGR